MPRISSSLRNSALGMILSAAALLLAACQPLIAPPPPPQASAAEEAETPTQTDPAPETSEELEPATAGLIQLQDPLDEPEYYCIDVPGFGRSLNLQGALTAHTCKPSADDEMFLFNSPSTGQFSMPAYNLCMAAGAAEAGSSLLLAECSASPLQRFQINEPGQIRLSPEESDDLCLTVAPEAGEPTGGPSHLRRNLTLETCDQDDSARSLWTVGSPTVVTDEP